MRVITGSMRGKRLQTLDGNNTRPTTEKVKEAVFSAIQFEIEGRKILDLFAGSGQMGIEALSRGAASAVFVDAGRDAVKIIEANIVSCGFQRQSKIIRMDYAAFLTQNIENFDIAFLDPPYESGILWHALEKTAAFMNRAGVIICEHPVSIEPSEGIGDFIRNKTYHYGKIAMSFYRHKDVIKE